MNPGSITTKFAVYRNEACVLREEVYHAEGERDAPLSEQLDIRLNAILQTLKQVRGLPALSAVVGRGGLLPPVRTGGYEINPKMLADLERTAVPHASNLGAPIAARIAVPLGIPAWIYDAVSASDFLPVAAVTGFPEIFRQSRCHVLNSRAVAQLAAAQMGKSYTALCFVVAHLGGGFSFSAHCYGKMIDTSADDDGAFSPERSGGAPLLEVIHLCYSGRYTEEELQKKVRGKGGLRAHLETSDCRVVEQRIAAGDKRARLIYEAMAYQAAKGIMMMAGALKGQVDGILLTGGAARSPYFTGMIADAVRFVAPVQVFPGERELEALAMGGLRILRGEEKVREYCGAET